MVGKKDSIRKLENQTGVKGKFYFKLGIRCLLVDTWIEGNTREKNKGESRGDRDTEEGEMAGGKQMRG